ncbi:MAG TPA: hypothetical protein VJ936_01210 [Desulfobacteraceae bacterium]|nr:hypothetical protein [Desulfobacteraceae bacterium]
MIHKVMIPLYRDEVAPRFDLAPEALIATISNGTQVEERRNMVLKRSSAEALCQFILSENISTVICNAIEEEYYHFLQWKKVIVFDCVLGPFTEAFDHYLDGTLKSGDNFCTRTIEGKNV